MKKIRAGLVLVAAALTWGGLLAAGAAELGRVAPPITTLSGGIGGGPATGLQIALFNPAQIFPEEYDVSGLRLDLIYGRNNNLRGLDLGIANHATGLVEGFQCGIVNRAGELNGLQLGGFNFCGAADAGCCQIGGVNVGRDVSGVQIGLFNLCDTISGVQIGLLNFITQSDFVIFCPFINAQF